MNLMDPPNISPGDEVLPLNGAEARVYLLHQLKQWLEGEQGLFSIGRTWPQTTFRVALTVECPGEDDQTVAWTVHLGDPEAIRAMLVGAPARATDGARDEEFTTDGTEPVRVHRGY